jgi:hypothetical protein
MVFKRMRDWPFIAVPTWAFGVTAFHVIQDHPAYIPCGQRWPLHPELAALLRMWLSFLAGWSVAVRYGQQL